MQAAQPNLDTSNSLAIRHPQNSKACKAECTGFKHLNSTMEYAACLHTTAAQLAVSEAKRLVCTVLRATVGTMHL